MNMMRKCMVGHDDDGAVAGIIIVILIAIVVIAVVCAIIFYGGIFIGGFHSIKNYLTAFKHNVFDSNRKKAMA